ncbi:MAG TPA: AI-2E family transporter [Woeseiaceae bacterium]|nr:AI-2E family transporter [Woeseiaceae bacterium]
MTTELRMAWLIAIAIAGVLLYLLAPVLTPFIAAALLAYIGDPLADRLEKLRLPRTLAVVTVFLLTFLFIAALVLLIGPLIRQQVSSLFAALPTILGQVEEEWLPSLAGLLGVELGDDVGLSAFLARYSDMAGSWGGKALESLTSTGGMLAAAVMSIFLIPILSFYMLRDWDRIIRHISALIPASNRDTVYALARETDDILGAFLRGQLLVMFGLACMYSLGLGLVGLEYAIAIGVVAGLVSFVPYLGFVFGITLATLTVVLEPDPLWRIVGVLATFGIAQMVEGSILTPKLVGDRIGLHPVMVIFAIAAGGQLFGFFGILLALPAAAVLSVLLRFAYNRYLKEHPAIDAGAADEVASESGRSETDDETPPQSA